MRPSFIDKDVRCFEPVSSRSCSSKRRTSCSLRQSNYILQISFNLQSRPIALFMSRLVEEMDFHEIKVSQTLFDILLLVRPK